MRELLGSIISAGSFLCFASFVLSGLFAFPWYSQWCVGHIGPNSGLVISFLTYPLFGMAYVIEGMTGHWPSQINAPFYFSIGSVCLHKVFSVYLNWEEVQLKHLH